MAYLRCRATYMPMQDMIQVSILLQNDDGSAATNLLKEGTAKVKNSNTEIYAIPFSKKHVVLRQNDLEEGRETPEYTDIGAFFTFIHHPAAQKWLSVECEATLVDDTVLRDSSSIRYADTLKPDDFANPMLKGRGFDIYPKDPDMP